MTKGDRPELPPPQFIPLAWSELISSCWQSDPADRPHFVHILPLVNAWLLQPAFFDDAKLADYLSRRARVVPNNNDEDDGGED